MKRILVFIISISLILGVLAGCSDNVPVQTNPGQNINEKVNSENNYSGVYEGKATGYHGEINVEVALNEEGKITSIKVDENHNETKDIAAVPIEKIPEAIISSQSLSVDSISGATMTGNGIIAAVANALTSAGLDPSVYGFTDNTGDMDAVYELDMNSMPIKEAITETITITDVKGREVKLDLPISTYSISTMDVIDFIIPILGEDAFNKLVGSGQDGGGGLQGYAKLYTPIVGEYMKHVGQISDHNAPFDLEMILAMDPDVLIVNSAMGAHRYALEIESQLTEAGIPIVLIDVPGQAFTTSVQDTLRLLGQVFQKEERANEVASFIDTQYKLLASKNPSDRTNKPTVYYEKSGYSEVFGSTSSSISGWGTVIATAGGDNIADPILLETAGSKGSGNTLDPEYIIQADPDFIILSGSGAGWMDNFEGSTPSIPNFDIVNRTGWNNLKAVKNQNVYELAHATSRSIFGFHATLKLASVFYPDEFKDVDTDKIIDEFFDRFMLVDSNVTGWFHRISEVSN
ncbi:MAG: ABC transporter substrate-binding protein [Thermotaleaceae bacterium]